MTHRMSKVCETWSLEQLVEMDEETMDNLLGFYEPGTIPKYDEVHEGAEAGMPAFDGSFGWW